MRDLTCDEVHDAAPGYALDILEPLERSSVTAHMSHCSHCRASVEGMQRSAADLLDLTSPQPVFTHPSMASPTHDVEDRTRAVGSGRRRIRLVATLAAAAALVVATTFGAALDHHTAPHLASAPLLSPGQVQVGTVTIYKGEPPMLTVSLKGVNARGHVTCELVTSTGTAVIGSFPLVDHGASWPTVDKLGVTDVQGVQLVDSQGRLIASATF